MSADSTKIFVGSLPEGTSTDDLRTLFEVHGAVEECDVIKDYGFVHMTNYDDAQAAISALNGSEFKGTAINVEESRSKVRQKPGMGGKMTCFRCGKSGHWSKECRLGGSRGNFRGRPGPYDRPPPFDRRPPPFDYEGGDGYDRRRQGHYMDRYVEQGYDDYDRGYDRGGYADRGYDRGAQYDDRRMDYYARRSPPRSYYPRNEPDYSNGSSYRANDRRPPYAGDRFGGRYPRSDY